MSQPMNQRATKVAKYILDKLEVEYEILPTEGKDVDVQLKDARMSLGPLSNGVIGIIIRDSWGTSRYVARWTPETHDRILNQIPAILKHIDILTKLGARSNNLYILPQGDQ